MKTLRRIAVTTVLILPLVACAATGNDDPLDAPPQASTTSAVDAVDAQIVFRGDFEAAGDFDGKGGSYSQFDSNVDTCEYDGKCKGVDSLDIEGSTVRAGHRALKITLDHGNVSSNHTRAEIRTGTKYATDLNVDYWYGWSIYVPKSWNHDDEKDDDQTVVHQWGRVDGEPGTSPILGLRIVKGSWRITQEIGKPGVESTIWPPADDIDAGEAAHVKLGQWTDWVMHVRWSPSPTGGYFAAWMGRDLLLGKTMQTMHAGAMLGPAEKMGLYGSLPDGGGPSQRILFYDEVRVARGLSNGYWVVAPPN